MAATTTGAIHVAGISPSPTANTASRTAAAIPAIVPSTDTAPDVPGRTRRKPTSSHVALPQAFPISLATVVAGRRHECGDHRELRERSVGPRPGRAARPRPPSRCWRWRCPRHGVPRVLPQCRRRFLAVAGERRQRRRQERGEQQHPAGPAGTEIDGDADHGARDGARDRYRSREITGRRDADVQYQRRREPATSTSESRRARRPRPRGSGSRAGTPQWPALRCCRSS